MKNNGADFFQEYSGFLDSTGEHLTYSALSVFRNFAGELSEKERNFLKNHLDSCSQCAARLEEVADVEGENRELILNKKNNYFRWASPSMFRYAAAAILLIAAGTGIFFTVWNSTQKSEVIALKEVPSSQNSDVQDVDPQKFEPNQVLENMVGRTVRSGNGVSFVFPRNGDTLEAPLRLQWNNDETGKNYSVSIVDNGNEEQWSGRSDSGKIVVGKKLSPGLYYIKLESDGVLQRAVKFFIVKRRQ